MTNPDSWRSPVIRRAIGTELEADLRDLIGEKDADLTRSTVYGDMYEVEGLVSRAEWKDPSGNHRVDTAERQTEKPGLSPCFRIKRRRTENGAIQTCSAAGRSSRTRTPKRYVATIVEHLPGKDCEDGYALEVFNAVGDTIAVITVPQSAVEPLTADVIPSVRPLAQTG